MRKTRIVLILLLALMLICVTGCSQSSGELKDKPLANITTIADFSNGESDAFYASNGYTDGSIYDAWWSKSNVLYPEDTMKLTINKISDNERPGECTADYSSSEVKSFDFYGYGDFEVCMKPSGKQGTVSSFLMRTGNYDTPTGSTEPNPWDEISIEFFGNITTKVVFNYYINGVGGHEFEYDLGFDASENFHEYGYRWTRECIVWFVDDIPVYKVKASEKTPLPSSAGRIIMNYICSTEETEGTIGEFSNPGNEGTEYKWITTSAQVEWSENDVVGEEPGEEPGGEEPGGEEPGGEEPGGEEPGGEEPGGEEPGEEEPVPVLPENNGITIDGVNVKFETDTYIVSTDSENNTMNVKYENVSGNSYKNISAGTDTLSEGHNKFTFTVLNNGTESVKLRIDLLAGSENKADGITVVNGSECIFTSSDGAVVTIAAAATETITVTYSGTPGTVNIFIDSATWNDESVHSGDITFSGFEFSGEAGTVSDDLVDPKYWIIDFAKQGEQGFYAADGYANNDDMFNCYWENECAVIENGVMNMTVKKDSNNKNPTGYLGAEYRTDVKRSYGYYAVCMKPAKGSGLVSSFFTYTNNPRWDEIDIEFLGKDTTKVQFNYYTDGVGNHEKLYDLGFDAAEDFHVYAFEWKPDSITWYVDGVAVYSVNQDIPEYPQQIMINIWNCIGHDDWTGALDDGALPATAQYKWIAYIPSENN